MAIKVRFSEKKILHRIIDAYARNEQKLLKPEPKQQKTKKDIHEEL